MIRPIKPFEKLPDFLGGFPFRLVFLGGLPCRKRVSVGGALVNDDRRNG